MVSTVLQVQEKPELPDTCSTSEVLGRLSHSQITRFHCFVCNNREEHTALEHGHTELCHAGQRPWLYHGVSENHSLCPVLQWALSVPPSRYILNAITVLLPLRYPCVSHAPSHLSSSPTGLWVCCLPISLFSSSKPYFSSISHIMSFPYRPPPADSYLL